MPSAPLAALRHYLDNSPTPFHAVSGAAARLRAAGYAPRTEGAQWECPRGKHYFTRNDSSLVAVNMNHPPEHGFRVVGAHTDSPCLRIKPHAVTCNDGYAKLAVEVYGGALLAPWFDRDLGLAGRVTLSHAGRLENRLLDIRRAVAFIPSLAIHLQRDINEKHHINRQRELPAVLCRITEDTWDFEGWLRAEIEKQYGSPAAGDILGFDLSLYDRQSAQIVGLHEEFIAGARLDNLLSCHAGIDAMLAAGEQANCVLVLNDHEEVGSVSAGGADGPLLLSILRGLCGGERGFATALGRSMLVSADNAHGVHPNYPNKHEPDHRPLLNGGPVIKVNSNQRYATSGETAALFRRACEVGGVPYQYMVARSDMACGSTIGPITAARVGIRAVDVGVAQLGMHSIRELAGVADQGMLAAALTAFYTMKEWPFE